MRSEKLQLIKYYLELIEEMALDELILFHREAYKISYELGVLVADKIRRLV